MTSRALIVLILRDGRRWRGVDRIDIDRPRTTFLLLWVSNRDNGDGAPGIRHCGAYESSHGLITFRVSSNRDSISTVLESSCMASHATILLCSAASQRSPTAMAMHDDMPQPDRPNSRHLRHPGRLVAAA
jgi:hypothetical protein